MNGRFYKTTKGWGEGDERRGISEPVSTSSIDREILCWAFAQEIYSELSCNSYGSAGRPNITTCTPQGCEL